MFNFLYDLHQDKEIRQSRSEARDAQSGVRGVDREVQFLQWKVDRLMMITEALWTIIRESQELDEQDLRKLVEQIDLQDGKLDGKVSKTPPAKCSNCGRTLQRGKAICMYCGAENQVDVFKR